MFSNHWTRITLMQISLKKKNKRKKNCFSSQNQRSTALHLRHPIEVFTAARGTILLLQCRRQLNGQGFRPHSRLFV